MNHRTQKMWFAVFTGAMLINIGCDWREPLGPVANSRAALSVRESLGGSITSTPSTEVASVAEPTSTGWATLRGRFTFVGTPPVMPPYKANKDGATCAPGGKAPPQELLVVDSASGGIKNVAIYVRKAPRVHESAQSAGETVVFDQKVCVFLSHVFPVILGQSVDIKNSDIVGHNTNITGKKNSFNQTIPAGESVLFKPQREEATPAPVSCSIHPWMTSYLLPRENGYVAVTVEDGSFELAYLPAGEELEIQVWHESATGPGGGLVLSTPEAKAHKWTSKGRFLIKLQPDEVKEIDLAVPASAFRG